MIHAKCGRATLVEPFLLLQEALSMLITRPAYSPEFRQQIIDLACAGRNPVSLSKEYQPTAETIRKWVVAAHSSLGYRSPMAYEAAAATTQMTEAHA